MGIIASPGKLGFEWSRDRSVIRSRQNRALSVIKGAHEYTQVVTPGCSGSYRDVGRCCRPGRKALNFNKSGGINRGGLRTPFSLFPEHRHSPRSSRRRSPARSSAARSHIRISAVSSASARRTRSAIHCSAPPTQQPSVAVASPRGAARSTQLPSDLYLATVSARRSSWNSAGNLAPSP